MRSRPYAAASSTNVAANADSGSGNRTSTTTRAGASRFHRLCGGGASGQGQAAGAGGDAAAAAATGAGALPLSRRDGGPEPAIAGGALAAPAAATAAATVAAAGPAGAGSAGGGRSARKLSLRPRDGSESERLRKGGDDGVASMLAAPAATRGGWGSACRSSPSLSPPRAPATGVCIPLPVPPPPPPPPPATTGRSVTPSTVAPRGRIRDMISPQMRYARSRDPGMNDVNTRCFSPPARGAITNSSAGSTSVVVRRFTSTMRLNGSTFLVSRPSHDEKKHTASSVMYCAWWRAGGGDTNMCCHSDRLPDGHVYRTVRTMRPCSSMDSDTAHEKSSMRCWSRSPNMSSTMSAAMVEREEMG